MAQVVLDHLTKAFRGPAGESIRALDDASLTVEDKELLVLVGPSGCGKTTTLRLIAGLEAPTAGTISIGGKAVNHVPPRDRDVAMVFQNFALYPHMTAYENLAFGLKLRRHLREDVDRRVREAATMLQLGDCLGRLPAALSGGQRQRVALGRALVRAPGVLLLDEPLSNLDAATRHQMRGELARLHAQAGWTLLYVTHDQAEALSLGHRVAVMRAGRIEQTGAPMMLYHRPANLFVAGFIGFPPMNFFEGVLAQGVGGLVFEEAQRSSAASAKPLTLPLPGLEVGRLRSHLGKAVVLGVRPEHITCSRAEGGPAGAALQSVVEVVQHVGAETHIFLTGHTGAIVARVPGDYPATRNDTLTLTFDLAHCHLFDRASGTALR